MIFPAMAYQPDPAIYGQKQCDKTYNTAYPDNRVRKHEDIKEIEQKQERRDYPQQDTHFKQPAHQIDRRRRVLSSSRLIGLSFLIALENGT